MNALFYDVNGFAKLILTSSTEDTDILDATAADTGLTWIVCGEECTHLNSYVNVAADPPVVVPNEVMALNVPAEFIKDTPFIITGVPVGTKVIWPDGVETVEIDGNIECTMDAPGAYKFSLALIGYNAERITINVVA